MYEDGTASAVICDWRPKRATDSRDFMFGSYEFPWPPVPGNDIPSWYSKERAEIMTKGERMQWMLPTYYCSARFPPQQLKD
jgi:hypothetical protein